MIYDVFPGETLPTAPPVADNVPRNGRKPPLLALWTPDIRSVFIETSEQIERGAKRWQTVSVWLTPNVTNDNGCKPKLDARIKLTDQAKATIFDRLEGEASQDQIAADFGVSQQHISRVGKYEGKKRARQAELDEQAAAIARGSVALILWLFTCLFTAMGADRR